MKFIVALSMLFVANLSFAFDFSSIVGSWKDQQTGASLTVEDKGETLSLETRANGQSARETIYLEEKVILTAAGAKAKLKVKAKSFSFVQEQLMAVIQTTYTLVSEKLLEIHVEVYAMGTKLQDVTVRLSAEDNLAGVPLN